MPTLQLESRDLSEPLASVFRQPTESDAPFHHSATLAQPAQPPLVLIVDDHEDSRIIERVVLESVGLRVAEAATGSDGLHAARRFHPSIVLLDIVLPELDGWDLARALRANDATRDTVLIAVTALDMSIAVSQSMAVGCNEVLLKPVPPAALLATLQRYVRFPKPSRIRAS
jgi:chemosensory pili system protein ChpA (sensor histidine kinase/response regulator)